MRELGIAIALWLAAGAAAAQPQPPSPVDLRIDGVFGADALLGDGYDTLVVTATNRTRDTFRGRILLTTDEYGQPEGRNVVSVDLPGGQTRRVLMTVFVGGSGTSVTAHYEEGGRQLGLASVGTGYAPAGRSLVMLVDPPRLRAALLDLQVNVPSTTPGYAYGSTGSEQAAAVPLGMVSFDPATADPILPDDALGWSTVAVAVVSIPLLARIPERELGALRDWVHTGGHLVLVPRTPADLATPLVRELFGEVSSGGRTLFPSELVPWEPAVPALACGSRAAEERFGCGARVGHGFAYVLAYDATGAQFVDTPQVRTLIRSIAQRAMRARGTPLAFGRARDAFQDTAYWSGGQSFSRLRAALDPNEGYRPALGLVAIVLMLYVVIVGPLNFRFVLKRNVPTLALVTTPIAAACCALLMLGVGYLGKGVLMRYRRVEIVQAIEGDALAPARVYTGFFLTRPTAVDIEGRARGRAMRLATGGDDGLVVEHGGERPRLAGIHGGLWETVFVREDRVVDLGGEIELTYSPDGLGRLRLAGITNHGTAALRSAFIVDESQVYAIGDVEPGATRAIPQNALPGDPFTFGYGDSSDPSPGRLATFLGLGADDVEYVRGLMTLVGAPADPSVPLMWARLDPEDPPSASPGFAREADLRFLMLELRPSYDLLGVAPAPNEAGSFAPPIAPMPDPTMLPDPAVPNGDVP